MNILRIQQWFNAILFTPISAKSFSILRIVWAAQLLITFSFQWFYYDVYFTTDGVWGTMNCDTMQCIILNYICVEPWIHVVFFTLITSLILTILGIKPRIFIFIILVIISLLHTRNWYITNGGDRVEKILGFMLLVAPNMHMYALQKTKNVMSYSWIQHLLLWQYIVLYGSAALRKLEVVGWLNGNKLGLALHSEQFMRIPPEWLNFLNSWYIPMSFATVGVQLVWLLLLVPTSIRKHFVWRSWPLNLKQTVILGTTGMHLGILVFMEIDMFPITMIIGYIGILNAQDYAAYKRVLQMFTHQLGKIKQSIVRLEQEGTLFATTKK